MRVSSFIGGASLRSRIHPGLLVLSLAAQPSYAICHSQGTGGGGALVLHVSPKGNDQWSGKLTEPNAGRTDGPLATIEGARDALRRLRAGAESRPGAEVRIAAATYFSRARSSSTPRTAVHRTRPSSTAPKPLRCQF